MIDEKLAAGELKDLIESKFAQFGEGLGERDRVILQQRLIAEEPLTLQANADRYGVTREAIRVSEKKLVERVKEYMKEALQGVPGSGFQAGGGLTRISHQDAEHKVEKVLVFNILRRFVWSLQGTDWAGRAPGEKCGLAVNSCTSRFVPVAR